MMLLNVRGLTQILEAVQKGDTQAEAELLALVYGELRTMARAKMARERPGHTLQATALVHEAWLRLAGDSHPPFKGRSHFFAAAGEAMRRILIERARRKASLKRGSDHSHESLENIEIPQETPSEELLAMDEALEALATQDPGAANLVKLRYFAGMTMDEAAAALEIPLRAAERTWSYARAWLRRRMSEPEFAKARRIP